ncbi:MAG TPA: DUF6263 family protein [Ferruginibacter sp.]|nr:DUF6263 family protein [Ferruginibacter sp.]
MKKILLSLTLFAGIAVNAQKITLTKGQQITISTSTLQDIDMTGMGMQMKNNTTTTSILEVKGDDKENYTTSFKVSKMNLTMDMMGRQQSYDSDKPEDKDSEMGKAVADKIGKEVAVLINKKTGKASLENKTGVSPEKKADTNPLMDGMMDAFGSAEEDASVETIFFLIPAGKKAGDTWMDSSSNKGMKEVKTYTFKSINDGIANIAMFATMQGNSTMETQGMQMDITLSAKTEGEILVDSKSSLVKKRSSVMDLTGSMDVMGQSIPIISKAIVNIDYK